MSGTAKGLIAGIAAVVLLGGGVAAMKFTEPKPQIDIGDPAEEEAEKMIYSGIESDVKTIAVENANGGYTFTRTHKAPSDSDDSNTYVVEGLENVKLDEYTAGNMAGNAASLSTKTLIEEDASDLSKYGLADPRAKVTVTFDGEDPHTVTLLVGDETPGGDTYVKLADDSRVYSSSSSFLNTYTYEKEYFISLKCVEEPDDDDYPVISSVRVQRSDLENDIVFEYDPYSDGDDERGGTTASHVMTSPVRAYLNVSDSVQYTHGIFGIRAKSVLSVSPSEQELEFAGILNPLCTVTMTVEDGTEYILKLGVKYGSDAASGGYIGYLEGTDVLWLFDDSSVPWMTMKAEDAMSSLVFGSYIYDVSSIKINSQGTASEFSCTGDSADNFKVKFNGSEYDTDRFREFFQALIKAPAEEICLSDEEASELLASVEISRINGLPSENVEFWKTDGNKVIIKKDGQACFKCRASFVNKALIPNINAISGTDAFVTNW